MNTENHTVTLPFEDYNTLIANQKTNWMTCSFTGFDAWNKANDINAPEIEIRKLFNELQGLSDLEHDKVLNAFIKKYQ